MKPSLKKSSLAGIALVSVLAVGCSGLKSTSTSGGGGGGGNSSGSFTIGGSISGLSGTGLVLQDNGGDNLTVAAAATKFTFATSVKSGGAYKVTVLTQPSNPAQTCTVTSGSGTASANVTTVAVTCTTNPVTATIGGTLSGLASGATVILQNNGGDSLTLTANGPFTFKTPVTGPTDAYAVTVNTQPTTPNQICTVSSGSGTATANVTNVAVSCVNSYTVSGTITGLVGTGFSLQDSFTPPGATSPTLDQLPITASSGNQSFTFKTFLPTGSAYTVSIAQQPSNPAQTCNVTAGTASGTVPTSAGNVSNVTVNCIAVTFEVSGTTYGLAGEPPNNGVLIDNSFSVHINTANTLQISSNGPFQFATPEALNDAYYLQIDHDASTQFQVCTRWNPQGFVTQNITNLQLDCGHNDWTFIGGGTAAGTETPVNPIYGKLASTSIPTGANVYPNPFTNLPGARFGAAGWTDKFGSLFLFGGNGYEMQGGQTQDTLPFEMNDLWVCVAVDVDDCEWWLVGSYNPNTIGGSAAGAQVEASAESEGEGAFYGPFNAPASRRGMASWTDTNGNLWLFGGAYGGHFLSDLWMLDTSVYDGTWLTYTTANVTWVQKGGPVFGNANSLDQGGVYPPTANPHPGAREYPVSWTDAAGNFWMFGGYGYDGAGHVGYLNDLWEYTGGNWVFKSGAATATINQVGIYGTQGTPAATNMPGARQEAAGWLDKSGTVLWLFGGEGEDATGFTTGSPGILNDLWMYDTTSGNWTFVAGSTAANQTGVYPLAPVIGPVNTTNAAGTCGLSNATAPCTPVSEAGAFPGSRWGAAAWVDGGGDLWLFGGWGLNSTATNGNGALNDLWVYTPNSTPTQPGTWAWIKGSNTGAAGGYYGSLLRPYRTHYTYTPGGRSLATVWRYYNPSLSLAVGPKGLEQFWLFGGEGYDEADLDGTPRTPTNGTLNDLWRYLPYKSY